MIARARRAAARLADVASGTPLPIRTEDGFELNARLHRAEGSRNCLVLCHGITSDCREDGLFTGLAREAVRRGISAVRFDFRGHGRSSGTDRDFTLAGMRRDLDAVTSRAGELGLGSHLLGAMSFGAAPAVAEAARSGHRLLLLWSPVVDYPRALAAPDTPWSQRILAGRDEPGLPEWAFARAPDTAFAISAELVAECKRDRTEATLRELEIPALAFVGTGDEIVATEATARVAAANPAIELRELAGEPHGLGGAGARVIAESLDWTEERLAGA